MKSSLLVSTITAILLVACSSPQYKVNPPTSQETLSEEEVEKEAPESQKDDYMRILGDLRWDQLTSAKQWVAKFPTCLRSYDNGGDLLIVVNPGFGSGSHPWDESDDQKCLNYKVGGVRIGPKYINFSRNPNTDSGTMATEVTFEFFSQPENRAFKAALAQKYVFTDLGYCSEYTCWTLGAINGLGPIIAKPSPHTISLLDAVRIDSSML